ncbi:MAG TPA: nicotinate-nucleotide adenylyltransferase [bacterium]|nr:nicotinate-nucleotide adenylyltransferase [bacterium]
MDRLENKTIGLLGGTFDPIHIGHLIIAEKVREEFNLEKVIFIPAGIPPHKKSAFTSSFHRYNMVKIAVSDNSFFDVSDIEIKRNLPSYTYLTIKKMKEIYKNYKIFFIIGQDSLLDLPNWYKADKLIKETTFIIVRRNTDFYYEKDKNFPVNFELSNNPIIGISSTYIRTCIKERKSIKYLLPEKVKNYIEKENIYG